MSVSKLFVPAALAALCAAPAAAGDPDPVAVVQTACVDGWKIVAKIYERHP